MFNWIIRSYGLGLLAHIEANIFCSRSNSSSRIRVDVVGKLHQGLQKAIKRKAHLRGENQRPDIDRQFIKEEVQE